MFTLQNSFTVGEVTPRLYARSNLDQYKNALATCDNFYPWSYGGLERRAGTRFVVESKTSSKKSRLIPFIFGTTQAYVLEFGDGYIRVFMNYGQVLSGGTPVEIATPYTENDLANIHFAQSFDKMYIVTGKHKVKVLTRSSHTAWTLADLNLIGPFRDVNTSSTTFTASASTGSVTITSSDPIFVASDVGRCIAIAGDVTAWAGSTAYTVGKLAYTTVNSVNRVYRCITAGTSGGTAMSSTGDVVYDGTAVWEYVEEAKTSNGYGTITAYTNTTTVTVSTTTDFPITTATKNWMIGAFNSTTQPKAVTIWAGRLWLGGSDDKPQTVWASRTNRYNEFTGTSPALDTDTITFTLDSGQVNAVYWFEIMKDALVIGTSDAIWRLISNDTTKAVSASTIKAERIQTTGSCLIQGKQIGSTIQYVGVSQKILHELAYVWSSDQFESQQMTLLAEHISKVGIKEFAYQARPYQMIWFARNDGKLLSFTYLREQKVTGWATHTLGGGGIVESVCVVPSADYSQDDVYMIVKRTINGTTKRYIEYMEKSAIDSSASPSDWFYVDCGLTYSGAAATHITGLNHLEGCTVSVLADGAWQPDCVVASGAITIQTAAVKVQVGLPYTSTVQTLRVDLNPAMSMQGKRKVIHKVVIDFYQSVGGKVGPSLTNMDEIFSVPYYAGPQPTDGWKDINYPGSWELDGHIYITQDKPFPLNIRAIMPQVSASDR